MVGFGRGGLGGIILVIGILYFTHAGSWMWNNIKQLDTACYSGLMRVGSNVATPVCGAVSKGIHAIDGALDTLGAKIDAVKDRIHGTSAYGNLSALSSSLADRSAGLTSSADALSKMVQSGPASARGTSAYQQAVDSFAIGQNYLKGDSMTQALPWLQQGAQQPQGYGVMSQISLGNFYLKGGNGVAPNPELARYYLNAAQNSIGQLNTSSSPQAKQLLQALPGSPEQTKAEIQRVVSQLK